MFFVFLCSCVCVRIVSVPCMALRTQNFTFYMRAVFVKKKHLKIWEHHLVSSHCALVQCLLHRPYLFKHVLWYNKNRILTALKRNGNAFCSSLRFCSFSHKICNNCSFLFLFLVSSCLSASISISSESFFPLMWLFVCLCLFASVVCVYFCSR